MSDKIGVGLEAKLKNLRVPCAQAALCRYLGAVVLAGFSVYLSLATPLAQGARFMFLFPAITVISFLIDLVPAAILSAAMVVAVAQLGPRPDVTTWVQGIQEAALFIFSLAYVLFSHRWRKTRAQLAASEQRLQQAFQVARAAAWEFDCETSTTWWSPEADSIFGLKEARPRASKDDFVALVHPDDKDLFRKISASVLKNGSGHGLFRVLRPDGETRFISGFASVDYGPSGLPLRLRGVCQDVTEDQTRQASLIDRERQLSAIYLSVAGMMFYLRVESDDRFRFISVNQALCVASGLSENDIVGKLFSEVVPAEDDSSEYLERFRAAVRQRKTINFESKFAFATPSSVKYGAVSITPITDSRGQVTHLSCIAFDITERKVTEEALRLFVDHAPAAIAMFDRDLRYVAASRRYLSDFQIGVEKVVGLKLVDLFPQISEEWRVVLDRGLRGEVVSVIEEEVIFPDGRREFLNLELRPWLSADNEVQGLFATSEFVTDRVKLNQDLRKAIADRDEFLSIASHELKTPLSALYMQLQLLERLAKAIGEGSVGKEVDAKKMGTLVVGSVQSAKRLANLLDELLDLTRIRAGKMTFRPQEMDLVEAAERAISMSLLAARKSGSVIHLTGLKALPGIWDPVRIDQIFSNLISNAIKYGEGRPIEIKLEADDNSSLARIEVRDYGLGVAKDMQAKIFEQYHRAVTSDKITGLGLGLYIVARIVQAQGGKICVESELGKGSCFIVELPIQPLTRASEAYVS